MNLNKKCLACGDYFPAKPMELELSCGEAECQKRLYYKVEHIKQIRSCSMNLFDIYDLDRPINYGFERVCRICGDPLLNKDGKYSYHRRYCKNHQGYKLFRKYNWNACREEYINEIREKYKDIIIQKAGEFRRNRIICEKCKILCLCYEFYFGDSNYNLINIHHIIPVHTLTIENLYLIWEKTNLIALCPECHHKQDHQLKKIRKIEKINFRSIMEFIKEK